MEPVSAFVYSRSNNDMCRFLYDHQSTRYAAHYGCVDRCDLSSICRVEWMAMRFKKLRELMRRSRSKVGHVNNYEYMHIEQHVSEGHIRTVFDAYPSVMFEPEIDSSTDTFDGTFRHMRAAVVSDDGKTLTMRWLMGRLQK